ncbi:MAG: glycosyl hydrolase [Chloroflexota bacterium]|nr:glycosyl hydrolase [Chloroflexota bacterium]
MSRGTVGIGYQIDPKSIAPALHWRCIGPPRGGRTVAVAGHPNDSNVFYFGACSGGVWKTLDGGTYWENISDGFFKTAAVGAIAVAPSDPNVIYVGTGEACIRNDVSHGDGVYRSLDGGDTWENIGLEDTRHISRIRVHPDNPSLVYVAALGHAFGSNAERGVFRSDNGGDSWSQTLFKSEKAGAADLSMDLNNPMVLYASIWEGHRSFWEISSGGPGSGLYKSVNGGETWTDLSNNPGMPKGLKGRIGVTASPAKKDRVWALVEAQEGGLLRSDDGGENWEMLNQQEDIKGRAWYYSHVFAHPTEPDTVWALCWQAWKSTDGGEHFVQVTTPHDDNHDLWIDPKNPERMIEGNDGGACVSFTGGASWSSIYNQPTSQFYHLDVDEQFPYRVYGTQQDNSAISVPSQSHNGAILWGDCYLVGSSESGHIAVNPDDSNIVYSGAIGSTPGGGAPILRYDHHTKQTRAVTVWPEASGSWPPSEQKYRFSWSFPLCFSPHDSTILYTASNFVFRSNDEGSNWELISPDLTRDDQSKQQLSGGPINAEGGTIEMYCTVSAFAESPSSRDLLWAGSDDGLVHVSHDGGKNWENVTPPTLPEWSMICNIEPSRFHAGSAYVSATKYKLDDYQPLMFKTDDFGKTWSELAPGFPANTLTRVIKEDIVREGLLFAGTETGVFISFNDGDTWMGLTEGLPVVPIHDIAIKGEDLIVATHGRSFWVLSELTVLRQLNQEHFEKSSHLFKPADTYRILPQHGLVPGIGPGKNFSAGIFGVGGTYVQSEIQHKQKLFLDSGTNPDYGVPIVFNLNATSEDEVRLTIVNEASQILAEFTKESDPESFDIERGMNRFVWDMRHPDAEPAPILNFQNKKSLPSPVAPLAIPGKYTVTLVTPDKVESQTFEILKDPRSSATSKDFDDQLKLLLSIRNSLSEARIALKTLSELSEQIEEWEDRIGKAETANSLIESTRNIKKKISSIKSELTTVKIPGKPGKLAQITEKLEALAPVVSSTDAAPTKQSNLVFEELSVALGIQMANLGDLLVKDIPETRSLLRNSGVSVTDT